ncbi:uncharacterized protein LOC129699672 [Leucoraja erinacea]|uniref:uncharacterized protein LOC129699672 n=1 Tax=Leucoraja erinaceus TaxID=7782 RepID=UPI002455EDA7|nr:uncharacterized protein LOC129699672 [Leucoraja erinacea]
MQRIEFKPEKCLGKSWLSGSDWTIAFTMFDLVRPTEAISNLFPSDVHDMVFSTAGGYDHHAPTRNCSETGNMRRSKIDELRLRITTHRRIADCNAMVFTEPWLNDNIPDNAIELEGRTVFRADRTAEDSSKTKGSGLCIYVNNTWCTDVVRIGSHCSADLEYLMIKCRPFYLPREFTSTVITAVYVPPDANARLAMEELQAAITNN